MYSQNKDPMNGVNSRTQYVNQVTGEKSVAIFNWRHLETHCQMIHFQIFPERLRWTALTVVNLL